MEWVPEPLSQTDPDAHPGAPQTRPGTEFEKRRRAEGGGGGRGRTRVGHTHAVPSGYLSLGNPKNLQPGDVTPHLSLRVGDALPGWVPLGWAGVDVAGRLSREAVSQTLPRIPDSLPGLRGWGESWLPLPRGGHSWGPVRERAGLWWTPQHPHGSLHTGCHDLDNAWGSERRDGHWEGSGLGPKNSELISSPDPHIEPLSSTFSLLHLETSPISECGRGTEKPP